MASTIKCDTIQSTTSNVFFQNSAGTEYARFDSNGNLGIGGVPPNVLTKFYVEQGIGSNVLGYFNSTATSQNARLRINSTDNASSVAYVWSYSHASLNKQASVYLTGTGALATQVGQTAGSEPTSGTTAMLIDSSGNVGIGTSSPSGKLNVISGSVAQLIIGFNATSASYLDSDAIVFRNAATTEAGRFTSTGLFQFNSGYGSAATAYGCRAWVNFNGTSTVAIRASGNVSSITDNGVGSYTVNFTNAMPDANYAIVKQDNERGVGESGTPATGSCQVLVRANTTDSTVDASYVYVAVFR